jgi:hypothetical protein
MSFAELVTEAQRQGFFEKLDRRFALEWEMHWRLLRQHENDTVIGVTNPRAVRFPRLGSLPAVAFCSPSRTFERKFAIAQRQAPRNGSIGTPIR